MQRAETEAHQALAIDSDSSEAHAALATVMRDRSGAVAEDEYKRALQLNLNNVAALWDYGALLSLDPKRAKESQALRERVARLDPRSSILWVQKLDDSLDRRDGGTAFQAVFGKALAMFSDDPDGLSQIAREARTRGFAPEGYQASLQNRQARPIDAAFGGIVPWLVMDGYGRAQHAAVALAQSGQGSDIVACWQLEIAGLMGDFAAVTRLTDRQFEVAPDDPVWRRKAAFWLAVQGRYTEAAQQLARGGPLSVTPPGGPGLGTSMIDGGQLLPAVLRIYRATGRHKEADQMAQRYFKIFRGDPQAAIDLAALAANEGDKSEAVRALKSEFDRAPLVFMFHPQLLWFRSLEGFAAYDQLLAERKRRVDQAHAEMRQLEANAMRSADGSH
jgi:tetratricopeptide (TPR) repeat protein